MTKTSRIARFLLQAAGKNYEPDPDIPFGLLLCEIWARLVMLIRGMISCGNQFLF